MIRAILAIKLDGSIEKTHRFFRIAIAEIFEPLCGNPLGIDSACRVDQIGLAAGSASDAVGSLGERGQRAGVLLLELGEGGVQCRGGVKRSCRRAGTHNKTDRWGLGGLGSSMR